MSIAPDLFKGNIAAAAAETFAENVDSFLPPLAFRRLDLRRMPGIAHGFVLDDLSPGINVIFGPNGCGKTRSAAAMNLALWPRGAPRAASIDASFDIGATHWRIELDAGTVRYRREGSETQDAPSALPPADNHDRYNLPLHELLSEDKSQFAQLIVRETAGGFDVPLASEKLSFKQNALTAKVAAPLREAKSALDDARRKQKDVHIEAGTLDELHARKKEAQDAADQALLLRGALKFLETRQAWEAATARVENFPAALKSLNGNEWKTYQQYSRDLADAREQLRRADVERNRATAALAGCDLPETGVPGNVLPTLSTLTGWLERSAIELRNVQLEKEKAKAARTNIRSRIAPAISDEAISRMVASDLQPFADLARRAELNRGQLRAEEQLKAWLGEAIEQTPSPAELQTLQEGIGFLQRWLREPRPAVETTPAATVDPLLKLLVWIATGLLAVVAIVLAAAVHIGWAAILLPAGGIAVVAYVRGRRSPASINAAAPALHEVHEREFSRLSSLPKPSHWTADEVQSLLQTLIERNAARQSDAQRASQWKALEPRRAELLQQQEELKQLRKRLSEKLGTPPASDDAPMYALVSNVIAWQAADQKVVETEAAEGKILQGYESDLAAAGSMLEPFGYPASNDPASLSGAADDLRRRSVAFEKARIERNGAAEAAEVASQRIVELESRILKIFKEAQIAPDEVRSLEDFCNQHPEYCKAVKNAEVARQLLDQVEVTLVEHEDLKSLSRDELRTQLNDAEEKASSLGSIDQQIGGIRSQIEQAKKSSTVESCLARFQAEKDVLREKRGADFAAVTGWVLAQHVKGESNDRQRPAVFRRARELFAKVTQGKYRLDLDDASPAAASPTFRAFDNATGLAHPLNELSGATRLQLLLSVRVAFVEQQEHGARLPIFIDEALANSDEHRAKTIIEAAIELARSGRQVFYFTAQLDEVAKWRQFLHEAPDVPHRLVDLAAVRGLAENERLPMPQYAASPPLASSHPMPGESYESFGQRLKVPAIDLWTDSVGGTNLWHLLDDPQVLHDFLRRGVSMWGQVQELRTSSRSNGSRLFAGLEDACRRAEAAATALSVMAQSWRVGRGRPVDRAALFDSDAVSATFADSVYRLAEEKAFDAAALIKALKGGEIKGFRTRTTEELRAYLIEHQYLDERPRLTRDEIRSRMLDAVGDAICDGRIDAARIDEYLDRWCGEHPQDASLASTVQ